MKKQTYISPELTQIVLNSKNDILNSSGYTQFSLFGNDGVGDDSDLDRVTWGK